MQILSAGLGTGQHTFLFLVSYINYSQTSPTWAISYLSDGYDRTIRSKQSLNPVLALAGTYNVVDLLLASVNFCSNACSSIVAGDDFPFFLPRRMVIRKEACWTISNITAGSRHQIQGAIDMPIACPKGKLAGLSLTRCLDSKSPPISVISLHQACYRLSRHPAWRTARGLEVSTDAFAFGFDNDDLRFSLLRRFLQYGTRVIGREGSY